MVGAAVIAGRAALKCGAGRVYLGLLTPHPPYVDYTQPELMLRKPAAVLEKEPVNVLVTGPGMGQADSARKLLGAALVAPVPIVLDADALNLIAAGRALAASLAKRKAATILTPHPAEAARLLGVTTDEVQADRMGIAVHRGQRLDVRLASQKEESFYFGRGKFSWFHEIREITAFILIGSGEQRSEGLKGKENEEVLIGTELLLDCRLEVDFVVRKVRITKSDI